MEGLEHIAWRVEDVQYPREEDEPVAGLEVIRDCFQCSGNGETAGCGFLAQSRKAIQAHCRKEHGWSSTKGKGGSAAHKKEKDPSETWTEGHSCQKSFHFKAWGKLFRVTEAGTARVRTTAEERAGVRRAETMGEDLLRELDRQKQEKRLQRKVTVGRYRSQANPWLEHTAWDKHLAGFERVELKASLYPAAPEEDEQKAEEESLERACQAVGRLIHRMMGVCRPEKVPRSALMWVNRRETGADNHEKPFYSGQRADTMRKYSTVWVKLLRYIWRTSKWEEKPSYKLTVYQEEQLAVVKDLASRNPSGMGKKRRRALQCELEEALALFWAAMLDHKLVDQEFQSGLISGLAVQGLDTEDCGWQDALNYTPKLAAIVTVSKALVVYIAWKNKQDDIQEGVKQGLEMKEAEENAGQVIDGVQEMTRRMLSFAEFTGRQTPMDRILHMKTYGMKVRFSVKGHARVDWKDGFHEISIDYTSFTMGDLRNVVHGLHRDCRDRLVKQLMFLEQEERLPKLELGKLFDNPGELVEGWSFLDDPRNVEALGVVNRKKWLWKRMMNEPRMERQFTIGDLDLVQNWKDIQWNRSGVQEYFEQVRTFKEELLVLCHMSAGAPARGTEITSIQAVNGEDSRAQRGIFITGGLVELVTSYHKGFSHSQNVKLIHRFLPQEVGEVMVYFLWLVQPWVEILQGVIMEEGEDVPESGVHFWEPAPEEKWKGEIQGADEEDSDEDSDEEGEREEDDLGSEAEQSDGSGESREGGDEEESSVGFGLGFDPEKVQKEGPAQNVDGLWSTPRLRRVMVRECKKRIALGISPSQWRQLYPAIQRAHSSSEDTEQLLGELYEGASRKDQQNQSGHGDRMEEMIYGVLMTENPFASMAEAKRFRKMSQEWHQFLQFPSAPRVPTVQSSNLQQEQDRLERERWVRLGQMSLQSKLQELVGPQAEFRGLQLEGLQAIVRRTARVLLIMRSGGGKSLRYMLPAAASPEGVSIVVVPLTAPQDDQERRCKKLGLRVAKWGDKKGVRSAQVVLVTPESAVTKAFGRFINEKKAAGLLDRIVIDECHVILDSINGWRLQMLELSKMAEMGVQLVYLTATLPPKEEAAFFHSSGVPQVDMHMLRDCTTRTNVAYSVLEYDKEEEEEEVLEELVRQKLQQYPAPGQVIIYCQTIKQCKQVGELLKCPMYFREVGDEDEKKRILQKLVEQRERVFAATNALGLGIDAPSIRVVIHLARRSKLRDYGQESGRAGRDGEKAEAIIMHSYRMIDGRRKVLDKGMLMEGAMQRFLAGDRCRRVSLDHDLDGRLDRIGCEMGDQRCDVCKGGGKEKRRVIGNNQPVQRVVHKGEEANVLGGEDGVNWGWIDQEQSWDVGVSEREGVSREPEDGGQGEGRGVDESVNEEERERNSRKSKRERGFTLEQSNKQIRETVKKRRMEVVEELVDLDQLRKKLGWLKEVCKKGCVICWAQKGDDARVWKGRK